jgi:hypothetical protein
MMSTEFQPPRKDRATGILLVSSPASAGRDKGVSRPLQHLTSRTRPMPPGNRPIAATPMGISLPYPEDVPAIGPGPTLGGISSGGAANDQ